ncbi:MAG: hypothetical protein QNJ41_14235 [Xenococcaceae cyanobacterium MO_188.B32]|nr:hypothetical protein [Xenococcaceae cyanobacterium MO_188.B32]
MLTDDQTVLYQLAFARQKLFAPDIPLCLKAISYVRICCSAMKKLDYFPECQGSKRTSYSRTGKMASCSTRNYRSDGCRYHR